MLRLIPRPLHRLAYRIAHRLRRVWWTIRKPSLAGCRALVLDNQGRVLLVRHSYGAQGWMLPGGGLHRGEDPISAAEREVREEAGCRIEGARLVTATDEVVHGAGNHVHIVGGTTRDPPRADGREITHAEFFLPDGLPANLSGMLRSEIPHWLAAFTATTAADQGGRDAALAPPPAPTA